MERIKGLALLAALIATLALLSAIMGGCAARRVIELHDRDMESWAGYAIGARVALDRAPLSMAAETPQRFNPAVYSARSLTNVNLYVRLPAVLGVDYGLGAWTPQQIDGAWLLLSVHLGTINAGERINAREALMLVAPPGATQIAIGYIITAQELREPLHGTIAVAVRPR